MSVLFTVFFFEVGAERGDFDVEGNGENAGVGTLIRVEVGACEGLRF